MKGAKREREGGRDRGKSVCVGVCRFFSLRVRIKLKIIFAR